MLAVIMIALGWLPALMVPILKTGVDHILKLVGGA
jgi:hypothetical protein